MFEGIDGLAGGLALGWLTLALGLVLARVGQNWWRQRRYGVPVDHNTLLIEYGRRMTAAPDRGTLGRLLTVDLPGALEVARAVLLLPDGYRLVDWETDELELPVSHVAVRWVTSAGEAQRADRGRLHELIIQSQQDLTWTRVWVPLMRGTEIRGMWLLGTREGNIQYAQDDLRCLTTVGRQAAIMLDSARYAEQEQRAASEMRALYRQVVAAREEERGRLSRELHDGVLQDLCALTRDLKALEAKSPADDRWGIDLADRSGATVNALRGICNDLRPPRLGHDLASALEGLVDILDERSAAPVRIDIVADELRIPEDTALAIFRITQEALHNAIWHADASEIAVRLTQYPDRLRLTVTDDGRGIAGGVEPARFVAEGHFGLAGMRERAAMIGARLDVQTAVDYGTAVVLELPQGP